MNFEENSGYEYPVLYRQVCEVPQLPRDESPEYEDIDNGIIILQNSEIGSDSMGQLNQNEITDSQSDYASISMISKQPAQHVPVNISYGQGMRV